MSTKTSGPGAVVITGASTGIGRACAEDLRGRGWRVFGTVRTRADADALQELGIEPLTMDVTKPDQVRAAIETVDAAVGEAGLAGLVNNAGIGVGGPLEYLDLDRLQWQLEVNLFGALRVTQACMPALRRAKGRVVNIGSIGGRIAQPLNGPYCISKSALAAATESLRYELSFFGMWASLVEPGAIQTPIWDKVGDHIAELLEEMSEEAIERYGAIAKSSMALFQQSAANASPPGLVARAVLHALTAKVPRSRYLVGGDAKRFAAVRNWTTDATWDWMVRSVLRSALKKATQA